MTKAQKNRPAGDAAKRQAEAGTCCKCGSVSVSQFTIWAAQRQMTKPGRFAEVRHVAE